MLTSRGRDSLQSEQQRHSPAGGSMCGMFKEWQSGRSGESLLGDGSIQIHKVKAMVGHGKVFGCFSEFGGKLL